jgi:poly-gamma-glutamate capsule biosynthesis protein CapA/YwtB (metallophosphatase superfamily)
MLSRLPRTPLDALSISAWLRVVVKIIHTCADIFGFWKYPPKDLSADFEEWRLIDKIYWAYKCKNPVLRAEKGSGVETFFQNQERTLKLPKGFERKHEISLASVGDLIKVAEIEHARNRLYEKVAPLIFDRDISIANLESQLTRQALADYTFNEKETPPLCCSKAQYDTLIRHKDRTYTVLHTASNHSLDMGLEGLETTLDQLEKDGIAAVGTNRTPAEQQRARIVEKRGIKIGFAAATYGLAGKAVPEGKDYLVNVVKFHRPGRPAQEINLDLLNRQIALCQEERCDIIIASLHWGYEYEFFPRQQQIEVAHAIVEAGADIIVAHHSHVIQPLEYYRPRRNPQRTAVIAYSLGNLTSSFSAPHLVLSGILHLHLVKGNIDGQAKTLVQEAELIPVVQTEYRDGDLPIIQIETLAALASRKGRDRETEAYISAIEKYAQRILNRKGR